MCLQFYREGNGICVRSGVGMEAECPACHVRHAHPSSGLNLHFFSSGMSVFSNCTMHGRVYEHIYVP